MADRVSADFSRRGRRRGEGAFSRGSWTRAGGAWSGGSWTAGSWTARPGSGAEPERPTPVPLWLAASGLTLGVGLAALAAEVGGGLDGVALLTGAAAAGGLGVFALVERLALRGGDGADPIASFEALLDRATEIAALVDRAGRIVALNRAAAEEAAQRGLRPLTAADLLFEARDPQRAVFEILGEAFRGSDDGGGERRIDGGLIVSATPAGGGLALWRVRLAGPQREPEAEATAPAPRGKAGRARAAVDRAAASGLAPARRRDGGGVAFDAAAAAAGVAWFTIGPTGRISAASPLFEAWTGARAGRRPILASLFPDLARVLEPGQALNAERGWAGVWPSRLIGAPGAPRAVTVALGRADDGPELFGVASPLPEGEAGAVGLDAAPPIGLGPDEAGGEARLLQAFDALSAERVAAEAAIGVLVLSSAGRVLRLNAAADRLMTDRAADAAGAPVIGPIGDHLIDWVAEEDREQAEARLAAAAGGGTAAFEARLETPGAGEGRLVQCYLSAVDSAAGRLVLCHLIDASEQRGLEQSFIQSQKLQAVGQLAGGVAHDFNNLLTVIIGSADLQMKRLTEDDPAYEDMNAIRQAGRRAAWLVGQLLAFSRKQTLTPKVADLTERCSELVFLLSRVIGERYEIVTEFEEALWPVEVDVNQFEQVVTNLVVNASHAMKQGGAIRVSTANEMVAEPRAQGNFAMPPGEYVRVTVEDRGCGIPREALAKIFEPFFTTKPVGQGTGLGLAVVYGVVKQSNGFVFVDSEVDQGTVFTIFLPRVSDARAAEAQTSPEGLKRAAERLGPPPTEPEAPKTAPAPKTAGSAAKDGAESGLPSDVRAAAALLGGRTAGAAPTTGTAADGAALGGARARSDAQPAPASTSQAPAPRETARGLARTGAVLLVEDQAAVRAFAARSLADRGHKVIEAESGAEALAALRDETLMIDLMLSDVVLEDTDGPSVLREIGTARPEMRVIFMSGYARDAFAETLESASAHAREARFLQKPFTLDELAEAVGEALASAQNRA